VGPHISLADGIDVVVDSVRQLTPDVAEIRVTDPSGAPLPPWQPGSHIEVGLPSGITRQYSLCGSGSDERSYTIGVLRQPAGRGGSAELHRVTKPGLVLRISKPRNNFHLRDAPSYLFLAGGIGITPLLPMVRSVAQRGAEWRLHYGARSLEQMAFRERVDELSPARYTLWPQDSAGRMPVGELIAAATPETLVYVCGPAAMLDAASVAVKAAGRTPRLEIERFTGPAVVDEGPSGAIEVELKRSGVVVHVDGGQSILDAVRAVVPEVEFSCQEGYCGTCETDVLSGIPDHRDVYLDDEEHASNSVMMICISRALTPNLVLDL